jgi:homogentisate 1,2-dioxygenase
MASFIGEPNPLRWDARSLSSYHRYPLDHIRNDTGIIFVDGLDAVAGAGDPAMREGLCVYTYLFDKNMSDRYWYQISINTHTGPERGPVCVHISF